MMVSARRAGVLWTTSEGIASWWAPVGFTLEVRKLDLRPGGELVYTMTVTDPQELEFAKANGLPLVIGTRKTFTEVAPTTRLAYSALSVFVRDVEPYEFLTAVELHPDDDGERVIVTADAMHNEEWTQRVAKSQEKELDNLAVLVDAS
jgi:uncharacterized protein YndB with AHSA1/START domain